MGDIWQCNVTSQVLYVGYRRYFEGVGRRVQKAGERFLFYRTMLVRLTLWLRHRIASVCVRFSVVTTTDLVYLGS